MTSNAATAADLIHEDDLEEGHLLNVNNIVVTCWI